MITEYKRRWRLAPLVGLAWIAWVGGVAAADIAPDDFRPTWQVGQKWVVETSNRRTPMRREQAAGWSGKPVRWQFEVEGSEKVAAAECFKVRITCLVEGRQPETVLWVDRTSMTLRRVETQLPGPDGVRTFVETYRSSSGQPFPAFAPLTVPPLDLPLFTSGTKGMQTFNYQASTSPEGVKAADDIDFSFAVEQELKSLTESEIRKTVPEEYTKSLQLDETKPAVEVRLKSGTTQVRQLWKAGLPWPLFGDNGVANARLVEVIPPEDQPKP